MARVAEYLEKNGGADTELLTPDDIKAFVMAYEEIHGGASTDRLAPEDILAKVNAYAEESSADTSALTPKDIKAMVAAYEELNGSADISELKPEDIVAYIAGYNADGADLSGISPEAITAFVATYQEIDGGAYTGLLTPKDIVAMISEYLEADGVDKRDLKPDQIEALVSAYSEATGCSRDALLNEFIASIDGYDDSGAAVPKPKSRVTITGYDLKAYRAFAAANPSLALEIPTRLGMLSSAEWEAYKTNGKLKVWQNGVEIPATPEVTSKLTADTVAVLDEDGTLHVIVTPEYTGSPEAIEDARDALEKPVEVLSEDAAATVAALTNSWVGYVSTLGRVDAALQRLDRNL